MLKLRNKEIHISKGDDAAIEVSLMLDGEPYTLQSGDKVIFTVGTAISKELTNNGKTFVTLTIAANDTKNMESGFYLYDLKMKYANGTICAILPPTTFEVMDVV